jgi:hypothetical protein
MQTPGPWAPGATPIVDFLLSDFERVDEFDAVKTLLDVVFALIAPEDHSSLGGKPYRKFPQKRWMRSHASCSAVVAVA